MPTFEHRSPTARHEEAFVAHAERQRLAQALDEEERGGRPLAGYSFKPSVDLSRDLCVGARLVGGVWESICLRGEKKGNALRASALPPKPSPLFLDVGTTRTGGSTRHSAPRAPSASLPTRSTSGSPRSSRPTWAPPPPASREAGRQAAAAPPAAPPGGSRGPGPEPPPLVPPWVPLVSRWAHPMPRWRARPPHLPRPAPRGRPLPPPPPPRARPRRPAPPSRPSASVSRCSCVRPHWWPRRPQRSGAAAARYRSAPTK